MGKKKNRPFAIKGESARSAEIIEVFEMLGVTNTSPLTQRILDDYLYFVKDGCIWVTPEYTESQKEYYIFKVETFKKKYPYKLNETVFDIIEYGYGGIQRIEWNGRDIVYTVQEACGECFTRFAKQLRHTREEWDRELNENDVEEIENNKTSVVSFDGDYADEVRIDMPEGYKGEVRNGQIYAVKEKSVYPKTFIECYTLTNGGSMNLNINCDNMHGAYHNKLEVLQKLLICMDCYRKIEDGGEERCIDWTDNKQKKYIIRFYQDELTKTTSTNVNTVFAFLTEEARDAFHDNFKKDLYYIKNLI